MDNIENFIKQPFPDVAKEYDTFFDIAGISHREDCITQAYAWFLNPLNDKQISGIFQSTLLNLIQFKSKRQYAGLIRKIHTQRVIDGRKRIDLIVAGNDENGDWEIIIENKIFHGVNNDLLCYFNYNDLPSHRKCGILLTLKPTVVSIECKEHYINITHREWISLIVDTITVVDLDARKALLLNDFLHAIRKLTINDCMSPSTEFYFHNIDKIKQLFSFQEDAERYILAQLEKASSSLGFNLDWYTKYYNLRYFSEKKFEDDFYYTIFYDGLFNENFSISIVLEFWADNQKRIAVLDENIKKEYGWRASEHYSKKGFKYLNKEEKEYCHYLTKDYVLNFADLKRLDQFVAESIQNDFEVEYKWIASKPLA